MKTLVLYNSKTGSTKKYAEDIAQMVDGDVYPLKKANLKKIIDNYDIIVFGGWVKGSQIQGINDFLIHWDLMEKKNVIVFSCGMSFPTAEGRKNLIDSNVLDLYHLRFYQLQGNFEYKKLDLVNKFLISNSLRMMQKDEQYASSARSLAEIKENPLIVYDQKGVDKIVNVIKRLEKEVEVEAN